MKIAGNRWLTVALDLLIALTAGIILYVFLVGGITIQVGGAVPGLGRAKLTCNKLVNPSLFLLFLLLLRAITSRPAPISRLRRWCTTNTRTILLTLLVALTASIPRLWNLNGHSLAPDELEWRDGGTRLITGLRAREFKMATEHLYYPGVIPSALIGASYVYLGKETSPLSADLIHPIVALRLPIALLGIATCIAVYLIGRIAFGGAVSFWAAVFLALLPEHIAISRIAHVDCALTLFFTLAVLCYLVYAQCLRLKWKVASAVFFGCALLTKSTAMLIPLILLAWKTCVCVYDRRGRLRFWEASDLGWLGVGLVIYFSLYTRLWHEPHELIWIKFVRRLPPAGVLIAVVNWVSRFPWAQGGGALLCVYILITAAGRAMRGGPPSPRKAAHPVCVGILLTIVCLGFVQVFRKPMVNALLFISTTYHFGDAGHLKYWMGNVVLSPPRWFYLFMLLICTPPLVLVLLICGIVRGCAVLWKRGDGWSAHLLSLLVSLLFIAAMSSSHKMAIRYSAPTYPFICLLSALGLTGIINAIAGSRRAWRPTLHALAGVIIVTSCGIPLARVAPYYDIYCNICIGGLAGASRCISIGHGLGTREAVEYLKSRVKSGDSIYVVGLHGEFRYYWDHEGPGPACGVRINQTSPPHVDWLVIPLGHRMRGLADEELRLTPRRTKVHAVTKCGIDFLDIYRVEGMPAGESNL